jgi:nitroimidazol reductase NimA-like FMN-containing flavoprotein (pyridoxamine 5'-phosphate oxidase superfamily)
MSFRRPRRRSNMTKGATANDRGAIAREIVDANLYMVLATADEAGRPWASPVYYTPDGYTYWVSSSEARHSQNLAARPELGIVISRARVSEHFILDRDRRPDQRLE